MRARKCENKKYRNTLKKKKKGCSRTGHSMVADVQTAQSIMHKSSASGQSSIAFTHTQQPIRSSVSVCQECKHTFGYEQEAHNSAG